jgi:hypothetical protein
MLGLEALSEASWKSSSDGDRGLSSVGWSSLHGFSKLDSIHFVEDLSLKSEIWVIQPCCKLSLDTLLDLAGDY